MIGERKKIGPVAMKAKIKRKSIVRIMHGQVVRGDR